MQSFKLFLWFYLAGLIIVLACSTILGNNPINIIISPQLYILPAFFCLIGFIAGGILYELKLRPIDKKKKLFTIGYCFGTVALLTTLIILSIDRFRELDHKKQFGNIESNHHVMKTWVNDNEEHIRIAFNRLEKEFKNPNDLDLDAFSIRKRDTMMNGLPDTLYNIYFVYFLKTDSNKYFSKVSVLAAKPQILIYNADCRFNDEYKRIHAENVHQEHEVMKELNGIFKQLKDSLKKRD